MHKKQRIIILSRKAHSYPQISIGQVYIKFSKDIGAINNTDVKISLEEK